MAGSYRLDEVLGRGGMGVVYRATAPDGRPVAVKMIGAHLADEDAALRFSREAQIHIRHPNVVDVLDARTDSDGTPYIVFELLEGESFETRIERGPLPLSEVVDLGLQACAGLQAVHEHGVVHRDLKPANLFRCQDGRIKVVDFGIALVTTTESRFTATGDVIGTPWYLSPEQARGARSEIDLRSDLWALGAVLYHAIAGQPPFDADSPLAVCVAVVMNDPEPLSVRAPATPPELVAIVERALKKRPDERFASAAEMAAALAAVDLGAAGPPVSHKAVMHAGENRLVAVLLAEDVRDHDFLQNVVVDHGGSFLPLLGRRALGVFGGFAWEGDELGRAMAAGLEGRSAADAMAVASGQAYLGGTGISGGVIRAAEAACAARLEGVAVSAEAAAALRRTYSLEEVGDGLLQVRRSAASSKPPVPPLEEQRLSMHGRDVELAQMHAALRSVLDGGRARSLFVTGPPGIGKSRLSIEMEQLAAASPVPVRTLVGRATPGRRDHALSLFQSVIEGRVRAAALREGWPTPWEGAASDRLQALSRLVREAIDDDERAGECATCLAVLLGAPMPEGQGRPWVEHDGRLMADRMRLALLDYFEGHCGHGPVVLVLEDLQWADGASLALLGLLLDELGEAAWLVFATARPELCEAGRDPFQGRDVVRIVPRALGPADVGRLAESIAGRPLPEDALRSTVERSGGNPLFVEQLVLALEERGAATADLGSVPLPLTVEAAVQSRLDHLPPAEKELCKKASVFGRPFSLEELEQLGVQSSAALVKSLARRDVLVTRPKPGGVGREVQFRSAVVAEVSYRMLAAEVRAPLHRRVAEILERDASADPEEIASHHDRGGDLARAAVRWVDAALRAAVRGDGPSVLRCSDRAAELGMPPESRYPIHMARSEALRFLGRPYEVEVEAALSAAATSAERARALVERAWWLGETGRTAEAEGACEQAIAAARDAGDGDVLVLALGAQAEWLAAVGRLSTAGQVLDEVGRLTTTAGKHMRAKIASWRARHAGALGDLGERRDRFREAAQLFREAGDERRAAMQDQNLADVANRIGAYSDAEEALRTSIASCRRVGNRSAEGYALVNLGYSLTRLGKTREALMVLQDSVAIAAAIEDVLLRLGAHLYLLEARLPTESPLEVARQAEGLADEAERMGVSALAALALALASRARGLAGDLDASLDLATRALALRDRLGSLEEDEAVVFLTCARALAATGRTAEMREVLRRGRQRLEEIAKRIADPELRARFLADVPANRELIASDDG